MTLLLAAVGWSLSTCVLVWGAFRYGVAVAIKRATEQSEQEIEQLKTLLARAGVTLDPELPRRLSEDHAFGSWTGLPIPDAVRPLPGSIPRWDEPSHRA